MGSAESNRLRICGRYNKDIAAIMLGYVGLAREYEFSGDPNVRVAGFDVGGADMKGDTAVVELGLNLNPNNTKWDLNLGLQGYLGAREGFSGNIQANYNF